MTTVMLRRPALVVTTAILAAALLLGWFLWRHRTQHVAQSTPVNLSKQQVRTADDAPTTLYAHNLLLRKGPHFRVYVRWIRGEMVRTHADVHPSLDDPESFVLNIQKGVIHANIGDISEYLNAVSPSDAPLKDISIQPYDGDLLKLHGTVHKVLPLPVELIGQLSPMPDGRMKFHVQKINVLKIPMKALLKSFHIELSDIVHASNVPGVQVADNDIYFDTQRLLPPPHIHGQITAVHVHAPDIEVIYGNAPNDDATLAQWHNFLRLEGGTVSFGKLTMQHADMTMIDASKDPWFDLDLVNYQNQLVNGYSRMTPQAGLEIFMPDVRDIRPGANKKVSLQWLKDRDRSLPVAIPTSK